jgi:hypothetical protein
MEKGQFCIRGIDAESEERAGTKGRGREGTTKTVVL